MKFLHALLIGFILSFPVQANVLTLGDFTGIAAMSEVDTGQELFKLTDANGDVDDASIFLLQVSSEHTDHSIGIYDAVDSSIFLEIFAAGETPITAATLSWDILTNEVTNVFTGDSAIINAEAFGFYDGDGYSQAALNSGIDKLFVYDVGTSGRPTLFGANVALVWVDDTSTVTSVNALDFKHLVMSASDITPIGNVPEPLPMALLAIGLVGLGYIKKVA